MTTSRWPSKSLVRRKNLVNFNDYFILIVDCRLHHVACFARLSSLLNSPGTQHSSPFIRPKENNCLYSWNISSLSLPLPLLLPHTSTLVKTTKNKLVQNRRSRNGRYLLWLAPTIFHLKFNRNENYWFSINENAIQANPHGPVFGLSDVWSWEFISVKLSNGWQFIVPRDGKC